ncbi:helix-turn-helix domain-containing protein [Dietzia natronolimnaea]|uniref:helix-turn-helix domain-containing protein n=1 Tax=Dietzia natronolimnaea TaxID=161920 RepID=UPI003D14FC19
MARNSGRGGAQPPDAEDIRLIEAAASVFAERGIKGASTDDIARAAGVTRVTLYRRLGPREQILRALYAHEAQRLMMSVNARAVHPVRVPRVGSGPARRGPARRYGLRHP